MQHDTLLEAAVASVQRLLPDFAPTVTRGAGYSSFPLPTPPAAEYSFSVYIYPDGEPQISAELLAAPGGYFWYYSFEMPYFDSSHEQAAKFLSELERLLQSESKIVETQGLLWRSYTCLLYKGGEWSDFGTHPSLLAPGLSPRRREFHSPPLSQL